MEIEYYNYISLISDIDKKYYLEDHPPFEAI